MMKRIGIAMGVACVCGGVSLGQPADRTAREAPANYQDAAPERPSASQLMQRNGGSLLRASLTAAPDPGRARLAQVSYFAVPEPEPRTVKKHDMVTIIVRESAEYTSDGSTELKKQTDLNAAVEQWMRVKLPDLQFEGGAAGENPPSAKWKAARNFKGEATVDRSDSFVARIAAEVVDVKPNGTFAVQAKKRIKHNEETQEYMLTGICRAADLGPDNTILSSNIHDLTIETTHRGAVRDTTKRGLIPKLLDFVNPF